MSENRGIIIQLPDMHMPSMSELTLLSISQKRKLIRIDSIALTYSTL